MRLRSLVVKQLPGLPDGRRLDNVQDGVTMLIGPNASGKSRLAEALNTVLNPGASADSAPVVTATFDANGATYVANRTGGSLTWTRDGQTVEPPIAPQDAARHLVQLQDLMSLDGPNRAVLERLKVELAGGFDLHRLREDLKAQPPTSRGRKAPGSKEAQALERAQTAFEALRKKRQELKHNEDRIKDWRKQEAALKATASRKEVLGLALDRLDADDALQAAKARRDALPHAGVLGRASEGVWHEVRDALGDLERCESDMHRTQTQERDAQAAVDGLAAPQVTAEQVDAWLQQADRLAELETKVESARRERDMAAARARREAGTESDAETVVGRAPEPDEAARLIQAFERLDGLRAEAAAESTSEDPAAHSQAAAVLARWLRLTTPASAWIAVGAAVAGVWGAWAVTGAGPGPAAWLAAGTTLVPVAILGGRAWKRTRTRREYEALSAESLQDWTERDALEAWRVHAARSARLRQDQGDKSREAQALQEAEQYAFETAQKLGIAADRLSMTAAGAYRWMFLANLHAARDVAARTADALAAAEHAAAETHDALHTRVAAAGAASPGAKGASASDWRAHLQSMRRAVEKAEKAQTELRRATRDRLAAEAALRQVNARLHELHRTLAGDTADELNDAEAARHLRTWLAANPDWQNEQKAVVEASGRVAQADQSLKSKAQDDSELHRWLEAGDRSAIQDALEASDQAATQVEDLRDSIRTTELAIEQLASSREREEVEVALQRARDGLLEVYEDTLAADEASRVIDAISGVQSGVRTPQLLKNAKAAFERFTHHRYDLKVAHGDDGELLPEVVDVTTGRTLTFDHLSTGTSAQLLLALRTASLPQTGDGLGFPLVLDEALTTSDPDRFTAVAAALDELSGTHQVLYLSAREDDARLWVSSRAEGERREPPHIRHMDDLQLDRAPSWAEISQPGPPQVPDPPEGGDWRAYATSLRVTAPEPFAPGGTHVLFVLPDRLQDVRTLTLNRMSDTGRLERLLGDRSVLDGLVGEEAGLKIGARLPVLHRWLADLARTQARPVTAEHLKKSGAISDTFFERVLAQVEAGGGDGMRLIQALRNKEVKGFRTDTTDQLEAYLTEHGCIREGPQDLKDARASSDARALAALQTAGETAEQARWLLDVWTSALDGNENYVG